jgi:hypothetical protein
MKFSAKTVMYTATFRDLALGKMQHTLVETQMSKYYDSSYEQDFIGNFVTYFVFTSALLCLLTSLVCCYRCKQQGEYDVDGAFKHIFLRRRLTKKQSAYIDETGSMDSKEKPLVRNETGVSA